MPFRFLDDITTADVAFEATAADLAGLLQAAADATLAAMVADPASVRTDVTRNISVEGDDVGLLLYRFLEELVFFKDAENLLLHVRETRVHESDDGILTVDAKARGERIDHKRHELPVDVKAVTFFELSVEETQDGWRAVVVLDV